MEIDKIKDNIVNLFSDINKNLIRNPYGRYGKIGSKQKFKNTLEKN